MLTLFYFVFAGLLSHVGFLTAKGILSKEVLNILIKLGNISLYVASGYAMLLLFTTATNRLILLIFFGSTLFYICCPSINSALAVLLSAIMLTIACGKDVVAFLAITLLILKAVSMMFPDYFLNIYWFEEFVFLGLIVISSLKFFENATPKALILALIMTICFVLPALLNRWLYAMLISWSIGLTFSIYHSIPIVLALFVFFLALFSAGKNAHHFVWIGTLLFNGFLFNYVYQIPIFVCCVLFITKPEATGWMFRANI